ncbi:MAG: flagellar hook-associated protein FlgK [Parvularculaceae bacterium]|nr:flagellar hook-associated protein FlgK [Parvularculaceae bacterium]
MSISQALSNATSGLGAASRQAGLVSQNIANALTPGYARREISLAERTVAGAGAGVRVAGVDRAASPALTAERRAAEGPAARDAAASAAAARISTIFGGPEDASSFVSKFSAFDRSLRDLANQPSSSAAQRVAVASAKQATVTINSLSTSLQTIRVEADRAIAAEVSRVNASLTAIEALNGQIERATAANRDASALLDERDRAVNVVNGAIPVRTLARENGKIDLITTEGAPLLAGEARQLSFTPRLLITADQTFANGALSGLSVDGVDITPGAGARGPSGGSIAGQFAVRDDIAVGAATDIDAFAADLIDRFAASGLDPSAAPGAPGLFTDAGAALADPYTAGLAGRLRVNASVDPDQGGDPSRLRDGLYAAAPGPAGSNALVVAFIRALDAPQAQAFSSGRSLSALDAAGAVVALRGAARSASESAAAGSAAYRDALAEAELGETGVDTDAELQQLLLVEQAFAANARVIEVTGRLIDQLTEL